MRERNLLERIADCVYIYAILDAPSGFIKIGQSCYPTYRRSEIKYDDGYRSRPRRGPLELRLIYTVRVKPSIARTIERNIHKELKYRRYKHTGEWFLMSIDEAIAIINGHTWPFTLESPPMSPSTGTLTIQGIQFTARTPYRPGHICTAIEAAVLNQCRFDNLRNNFAKVVKDTFNGSKTSYNQDVDALQHKFREYDANYTFAAPASVDPVDTEARRIAQALVREEFNKRGLDAKAQPDRFAIAVGKAAALPAIIDEATRRVTAKREAAAATGLIIDGV